MPPSECLGSLKMSTLWKTLKMLGELAFCALQVFDVGPGEQAWCGVGAETVPVAESARAQSIHSS